jgi:acyl-CoA thioesterase-2
MNVLAPSLQLDRLRADVFQGYTPDDGSFRIFGGQVLAQFLLAAFKTVESGRLCHSFHAYFLHPGDPRTPIVYEVERARDGGSFTTRRVTALQDGRQIFHASASFQTQQDGLEHQVEGPQAPPPSALTDDTDREAATYESPEAQAAFRNRLQRRALEMRSVNPAPVVPDARQQLWIRSIEAVAGDAQMQQVVMAYASDLQLLWTALRPHGLGLATQGLQIVSLDHAMWFHRPSDFHTWHFYDMDSPSTSGGRGLNRGALYREDGTLVATTMQEGLIRVRPPQAG